MILLIIAQINKIIWFQYSSTGCLTCHKTPILKMNDSTYILGSAHYNNRLRIMLMGIKVKTGITVEWYKAWLSNPDLDLHASALTKINDTLIAVGGGHGGCASCSFFGLFNLKTQNFVWAKYLFGKPTVRSIAYDGNSLVLAAQATNAEFRGAIIKTDLNGNVIWAKETSFGCLWNDNYSIIPEQNGYIVMGLGDGGGCSWHVVIYRISLDGSSATLIKGIFSYYAPYNLLRDGDGNYVLTGFGVEAFLSKIDPSGNVIYSKLYTANNELRFYDIALDLDGNYLLAGLTKIGSTSYPIAIKINKNDGSVIWARRWSGAPANQANNLAKGIIPVTTGKILVSGYLGTSVDNHNGFFVILDSADCMTSFQVNVYNFGISDWSPSISLSDYSDINNLTLTPYNFSISQTASCSITPISDNEYKSCNYIIYGSKGFIAIKSENKVNLKIFSISGYKVKEVNIKEGKIKINPGIYIVQIGKDKVKIIVK
jgi:hypothetical protein